MTRVWEALAGGWIMWICCHIAVQKIEQKRRGEGVPRKRVLGSPSLIFAEGTSALFWIFYFLLIQKDAIPGTCLLVFVLLWGLNVLAITDGKWRLVPNEILLLLGLCWLGIGCMGGLLGRECVWTFLWNGFSGACVGGGILGLASWLSHKKLGAGDVKLAFVLGLYLAETGILSVLFYSMIIAGLVVLIQLKRAHFRKNVTVPLVPFFYLGTGLHLILMCFHFT